MSHLYEFRPVSCPKNRLTQLNNRRFRCPRARFLILFRLTTGILFFCLTLLAQSVAWSEEKPGSPKVNAADSTTENAKPQPDGAAKKWNSLTKSWVVCQFGGDGDVEISDDLVTLGYGDPLTGIRWEGPVERENYEVSLEARRTEGFDFFCGLTFPVGEASVTLILGGWGGGVMGISNVDDYDASDNETTQFRMFDNEKWYAVRARVTKDKIACWVDNKQVVDLDREGRRFDVRSEMLQCVPLGIAAFQCESEIRKLRFRKLTAAETDDKKPEKTAEK